MSRRLTPEEKSARAAEREAKQKAARDDYIKKILDDWPPLTSAQIDLISVIMYPGMVGRSGPRGPSAYELERRREAQEREDALKAARKLAESMTACDVCDLQPDAHRFMERRGIDSHEWMPGRAQKILDGKC